MKFKKLLIYNIQEQDTLDKPTWASIRGFAEKIVFVPLNSPKLKDELAETDGILVNFGTVIGKDEMDSAPKLKYIGVMATAFGKIDVIYAKKKKIIVSNLKGYSTDSVAEFVLGVILENIRGLEEGKNRGRSENYSEIGIPVFELKNKTFGIVGLGTIGQAVAKIAQGFGSNVVYWSKNRKKNLENNGVEYLAYSDLISKSDIISINLAQNSETENFLSTSTFQKVKSGVVIVNTAPMDLIDIDALVLRLKKGDITFILDHSDEMSASDLKKISKYKNCVIYPPMAYISREAADNKKRIFAGNIEGFLSAKPQNVVS